MKIWDKIGAGLLCAFVLIISLGYLALPDREFSSLEKRYLTQAPELAVQSVLDGDWSDSVEDFLADQMPGRDFFVGLNAYCEKILGLQKAKTIWTLNGKLVRCPVVPQPGMLEKNIAAVNQFAQKLDIPVSLSLIPSCGFSLGAPEYQDDELINEIYEKANLETIDLRETYRGRPELFYSTDHHWTSTGAFDAYKTLMEAWGKQPETDYTVERFEHFRGANFAASCLWLTPEEALEMWTGPASIEVKIEDKTHEGVFYRERLEDYDPYMVFLDGNHPVVNLHNPKGNGNILLIRDSFASSLAGFLAQNYENVTLVDLRYYKLPVSQLAESYDWVLVLYSLENFLTDSNIVLLK